MRINFAHICDYASVSREGKLSLNGIFDFLASGSFPVVHPTLYLVFEISLSAAELNTDIATRVVLQGADGQEVMKAEQRFKVGGTAKPGERPKVPQLLPITNLPIPGPGNYQFSIFINGSHQVDVPFRAIKLEPKGTPKQ